MTNLTIEMDETILSETEKLLIQLQLKRDEYINQAVSLLNKVQKRKLLGEHLKIESKMVQAESMKILAEFENLDDEATAV